MSGTGDTLAGIVAGLAARGGALEQAVAWVGPLGPLASELAGEIPALMELASARDTRQRRRHLQPVEDSGT